MQSADASALSDVVPDQLHELLEHNQLMLLCRFKQGAPDELGACLAGHMARFGFVRHVDKASDNFDDESHWLNIAFVGMQFSDVIVIVDNEESLNVALETSFLTEAQNNRAYQEIAQSLGLLRFTSLTVLHAMWAMLFKIVVQVRVTTSRDARASAQVSPGFFSTVKVEAVNLSPSAVAELVGAAVAAEIARRRRGVLRARPADALNLLEIIRAVQAEAFAHPVFAPFYRTHGETAQSKPKAFELALDPRALEAIRKQLNEFWLERHAGGAYFRWRRYTDVSFSRSCINLAVHIGSGAYWIYKGESSLNQRIARMPMRGSDPVAHEKILRVMRSPWMTPILSLDLINRELRSFQTVSYLRLRRQLRKLHDQAQQQYSDGKRALVEHAIAKLDTSLELDRPRAASGPR